MICCFCIPCLACMIAWEIMINVTCSVMCTHLFSSCCLFVPACGVRVARPKRARVPPGFFALERAMDAFVVHQVMQFLFCAEAAPLSNTSSSVHSNPQLVVKLTTGGRNEELRAALRASSSAPSPPPLGSRPRRVRSLPYCRYNHSWNPWNCEHCAR